MMPPNKLLHENDKPGQYPGSWYAASAKPLVPAPALQEPVDCDVCIIGGGFTGLSAAITLAEQGVDAVLLDAHRVGWGASGRNGGQLGSGQRVDQTVLEKKYGKATARALWDIAQASKQHVRELIQKHAIDCDYQAGIMHVDHKASFSRETAEYVEKLNEQYDYREIAYLDKNALRQRLASNEYHSGSIDIGAAHLHPLKLAIGLARAATNHGVRVYENTEVLHYKSDEKQVVVTTEKGQVKAKQLLLACNGYLGKLSNEVAAHVMPINNYIIATEPFELNTVRELIKDNVAVADSKFVVNYFRRSADNRLLFGGRESYGYRFPEDIQAFVKVAMLQVFPQLKDCSIDYGWGGTLAITMNRMPHLRQLETNVMSSSGYSGHGVGMASYAGKLCADAIAGKLDSFNVMAGIKHQQFPGGAAMRSPLLKLGMLYYSMRDRL